MADELVVEEGVRPDARIRSEVTTASVSSSSGVVVIDCRRRSSSGRCQSEDAEGVALAPTLMR